uniref:Uncharacterized protein n=1 Tax=Amphora coffeiformis TaxID=265554 RepID=A0A7S3KZE7_9STRA|mmetsp:Transcript_11400/g.21771  ORF Transcript_11400/g.21771 Transcript_11400/m.21771 type:complete len:128 (+) Transcript_11400:306-689(+)
MNSAKEAGSSQKKWGMETAFPRRPESRLQSDPKQEKLSDSSPGSHWKAKRLAMEKESTAPKGMWTVLCVLKVVWERIFVHPVMWIRLPRRKSVPEYRLLTPSSRWGLHNNWQGLVAAGAGEHWIALA